MSAELVGVVVYDSVLFEVGHNVRRWADAVETRFTAAAIAEAPINKRVNKSGWYPDWPVGGLKAGIHGQVDRIGPKMIQTLIHSDAPYSLYVIEGTDFIYPTSARKLRLPVNYGFNSRGVTLHSWVRGQRANDFLGRAHDITAAKHPSIRRNSASAFKQW